MIFLVLLAGVVLGIMVVLYSQVRGAEDDRDEWRVMAAEARMLLATSPLGHDPAWDLEAWRWVAGYNAMLEPEG